MAGIEMPSAVTSRYNQVAPTQVAFEKLSEISIVDKGLESDPAGSEAQAV